MSMICRDELQSIKDSIECCLLQQIRKGDVDIDALETWCKAVVKRINAALAKPPRNCDVGTVEEQNRRFDNFCREKDCKTCPCNVMPRCHMVWAQMPYGAEGGAEK